MTAVVYEVCKRRLTGDRALASTNGEKVHHSSWSFPACNSMVWFQWALDFDSHVSDVIRIYQVIKVHSLNHNVFSWFYEIKG